MHITDLVAMYRVPNSASRNGALSKVADLEKIFKGEERTRRKASSETVILPAGTQYKV